MAVFLEVKFRLRFGIRHDEEADVHVGYCPLLNLYSQGTTSDEAEKAIIDAAQQFIAISYKRNTLGRVLRNRGMVDAAPAVEHRGQFIAVEVVQKEEYDREFEIDVPIDLLASAAVGQEQLACR